MFDTDLTREYEAAAALGCDARTAFAAGVRGALCDDANPLSAGRAVARS